MKHTPGPWQVEAVVWFQDGKLHDEYPDNDEGAEYYVQVGTDAEYVAFVGGDGTQDGNAALISVAPEMYAILADFARLGGIEWIDMSENQRAEYQRAWEDARALLTRIDEIPQEVK